MTRRRRFSPCSVVAVLAMHGWSLAHAIDPAAEAHRALQNAQTAIQRQQWALAEQWLERGLMYQPENAEAQLDLARLLARRGEYSAAIALVQNLLTNPQTPAALRPGLQAIERNYTQLQLDAKNQAHKIETGPASVAPAPLLAMELYIGRASNPAARTASPNLQLTIGSDTIELPLQDRPEPGVVQGVAWVWQPQSGTRLAAQLQQSGGSASLYSLSWQHQQGAWVWSAGTLRQAPQQHRHDLSVAYQQQAQRWHLGVFQEPERQRQGWLGGWHSTIWAGQRSQVQLGWMYEHPTGQPLSGGAYWRGELAGRWQLAPAWHLTLKHSHQQDLAGYSPWLQHNAQRQLRTTQAVLDWTWRQTAAFSSGLQLYATQRSSNLPLFAYQDIGLLWLGRYNWRPSARSVP